MTRLLFAFLLLLLFAGTPTHVFSQWTWNGSMEVGLYQNQNIFKSPDRLLQNGQSLGSDSLYQNDMTIPVEIDAGLEYKTKRHRLELEYRTSLQRYNKYGNLNGGFHAISLSESWQIAKSFEIHLKTQGRKTRRVGTNVLGDELSRLFEYTSLDVIAEIEWTLTKRQTLSFNYRWHTRDYAETTSAFSLDSYSHYAGIDWTYRTARRKGAYWQTDFGMLYRTKQYRGYFARDESGRQSPSHPINHLDYYDMDVRFKRAWSRQWAGSFQLKGRYRHDPFEDFYTYGSGQVQIGVEWSPSRSIELALDAGWRRVLYEVKDAPQADSGLYPALEYDYFDWSAELEYDVFRSVSMLFFVESDSRYSNVTLESFRVRRSYNTTQGGIQVKLDLDKML